jgi:hypothetical protein
MINPSTVQIRHSINCVISALLNTDEIELTNLLEDIPRLILCESLVFNCLK